MKLDDKTLGMNRNITRRDLLHGASALATASLFPTALVASVPAASVYPPGLMGMRGNHDGSFDVAHQFAREGRTDWGSVEDNGDPVYDLVVVGAGLSGLAAAHFYLRDNPDARILILDNHDDFGGHAKRNEFTINGETLLGHGGSQTIVSPSAFSSEVKGLLDDLGIDLDRFYSAYDQEFYLRHNLSSAVFLNEEQWGSSTLARYDLPSYRSWIPLAEAGASEEDFVSQLPLSGSAREQLLKVLTATETLSDIPVEEREEYLGSVSYPEFLKRHLDVDDPDVIRFLNDMGTDGYAGIQLLDAATAMLWFSMPGYKSVGIPDWDDGEPYIHHFPDGNASVARLLVRKMIPDVAPGTTMDDVVTAKFDYNKLDQPTSAVRVRLNSTVTHVENVGAVESSAHVLLNYVTGGTAHRVKGKNCVLACYNAIIPHIMPELAAEQSEALSKQVKQPMVYTNVALTNWRAWKKLGVGFVYSPESFHSVSQLNFPVSMGGFQYTQSEDDPVVVHMEHFPAKSLEAIDHRDAQRQGRYRLLGTPFETFEREIRQQLSEMLADGGFDPADDIAGITVNRWAHGYADMYNWLQDPYYGNRNDPRYPHVIGRQPVGRVAIANSDSGAMAQLETAVEQAYRAVRELS